MRGLWLLGMVSCASDDPSAQPEPVIDTHSSSVDTGDIPLPSSFEVTGTVFDQNERPLTDAMVLVGGQDDTMVYTESDGSFTLWFEDNGLGEPVIVAAKKGYRAIGYEYFRPDTPISLTLLEVQEPDNTAYVYEDPGDGVETMREDCSHCHTSFVRDFLSSGHVKATRNPMLQDLYAGVTQAHTSAEDCEEAGGRWTVGHAPGTESETMDKCYLGGGVLPDLNPNCGDVDQPPCDGAGISAADQPEMFGACADCHAPGINGVAGGRNLHEAHGLAFDIGVHCDTCHKVRDIDMEAPPGVGKRLVMGRPSEPGGFDFEWAPVFYGPLVDVPNVIMGGSYQPKFNDSVFCAGCHQQHQEALIPGDELDEEMWPDGLPIHTTYSEWESGPYNQEATACQFCHMPADVERNNSVDISTPENQSITFGFPRAPEDNRKHTFRGPLSGSPRLIDEALYVSIALEAVEDNLEATISVANVGCGHAVPTGEPMRSLLLLVEANGDCGPLRPSGGMTIPDIGGAMASGIVGDDIKPIDVGMMWSEGVKQAEIGDVVRIVRPTGVFYDYNGPGIFSEDSLDPEDKGMEILSPVETATVVSIEDGSLMLDTTPELMMGDLVYLGESWPAEPEDGQSALHIAGQAGTSFSKVLLDAEGNRNVPHYRAVDIASDNRIPPGKNALTSHAFEIPDGCSEADVQATVLYRPVPLHLARLRGWPSDDHIIATANASWRE